MKAAAFATVMAIVAAMATQSLYRRYRPRRFSEVKGQDHVVRALRNSVIEGREGQAYLFSGPRGTGKTTSARILAKVLNCTSVQDGEPCCECESCLSVERGTSYDVHELDAASNNGVEAMRDLIDKASLGTPGRHKVYILDEVHMLTKGAEAALLKTLEEPPPHVVFVLATTDPQKMSDTIRSRTQHLQFHLFSADALQDHVRWVAADAGLDVSDIAIDQVVSQGAGSARDALSALELVASTGGVGAETVPFGQFVDAMTDHDAGAALKLIAAAIGLGRDPRTLTEELIGYLRNGFLSLMAPELVQLPSQRIEQLTAEAQRLGAAGLVRGIEKLGEALTEMRHAPDPRVLLDVAIVYLTADRVGTDLGALTERIVALEKMVAAGVAVPAGGAARVAEPSPVPVDPTTGRATLGGRARTAAPRPESPTAPSTDATAPSVDAGDSAIGSGDGEAAAVASGEPDRGDRAEHGSSDERDARDGAGSQSDARTDRLPTADTPRIDQTSAAADSGAGMSQSMWDETVRPGLRGMARAVFAPAEYVSATASSLTLKLPNAVHRDKCEQHRRAVEDALRDAAGAPVSLELILDGGGDGDGGDGEPAPGPTGRTAESDAVSVPAADQARAPRQSGTPAGSSAGTGIGDVVAAGDARAAVASRGGDDDASAGDVSAVARAESPRRAAERKLAAGLDIDANTDDDAPDAEVYVLPEDHEVDLEDLVDAPPESVKTPIDRLAEAFPGSELMEESY